MESIIIPLETRPLKTVIRAAPPLFEIIYLERLRGGYPMHESIKAVWKDQIDHVEPEKRNLFYLRSCFPPPDFRKYRARRGGGATTKSIFGRAAPGQSRHKRSSRLNEQ